MKRLLWAVCVALAGCQPVRVVEAPVCPAIPASLLRDCERCLPDDPTPQTNGELAEAWMDCRQCLSEYRIRMDAIGELAGCRNGNAGLASRRSVE